MTGRPMQREPMKTIGGKSVRNEIDERIAYAESEARAAAFDEAIAFLGGSGFIDAAEALRVAAFEPQPSSSAVPS